VLLKENASLKQENSSFETRISTLTKDNNVLLKEAISLIPALYKVKSQTKIYYRTCDNNFEYINCLYKEDGVIKIYAIEKGYALADAGWVQLSNLIKQ
jgi:hypothetical protein